MLKAEYRAENKAEYCGGNAAGHQNFAEPHAGFFPHEQTDQRDAQPLPKIGEHDAEHDNIGDSHKDGGVNLVVRGKSEHFHKELKRTEQSGVLQLDRRGMLQLCFRVFERIFYRLQRFQ